MYLGDTVGVGVVVVCGGGGSGCGACRQVEQEGIRLQVLREGKERGVVDWAVGYGGAPWDGAQAHVAAGAGERDGGEG